MSGKRKSDYPLCPEIEAEIAMINHRSEIEMEDDKRRFCSDFGYRRGGVQTMMFSMFVVFVSAGFAIVFLAAFGTGHSLPIVAASIGIGALAVSTVLPFLFLKPRYAVRATMGALILFATLGTMIWAGEKALFALLL